MSKLLEKVRGKKTYIVAGAMVLFSVLGFFLKMLEPSQAGEILLEALAIAGLRAGLAK